MKNMLAKIEAAFDNPDCTTSIKLPKPNHSYFKLAPQGIMLCVAVSPAPDHRGGHHAVKNTRKHHALNAYHIRRARLVQLSSLAPFALRFRFLIPLSAATSLKTKSTRSGSHAFLPFVKTLHASALLRGASPSLTSGGLHAGY
ncbi:MAG TPA: hypothetical protein VLX61_04110 [Anaerolineales bacterium]|nr:hypothetical protein [Anaerolineales bacterium]